jgi:hypothetical protein
MRAPDRASEVALDAILEKPSSVARVDAAGAIRVEKRLPG